MGASCISSGTDLLDTCMYWNWNREKLKIVNLGYNLYFYSQAKERFAYVRLPQIEAVITAESASQHGKHCEPAQAHKLHVSLATLDLKLEALEKSSPLSDVTKQLLGDGGPLALIEPKVLNFAIADADKESTASILLTNNTNVMELFKVSNLA